MGHQRACSEEVPSIVAEDRGKLINNAPDAAWQILVDNREILDNLVLGLLEKETLDKNEVARVFTGIRKKPARPAWTGSAKRTPSERGPVLTPKELELVRQGIRPNGDGQGTMGLGRPTDVPPSPLPGQG